MQPGDVLRGGRYEIQRLLGSGLDKKVYLGVDLSLGHQVAIDVFNNNNPVTPGGMTVSAWEARVLGRLGNHPNIATVQEHWEDDGTAVMVTRYLPGGSLRDRIVRARESGEPITLDVIVRISTEIARGLAYIHGRRILYRDLQPRNVLFDEWGTVHLVDFDTAVSLDDEHMSDLSERPDVDYMAPEVAEGRRADERADLYSLGVTMFEMCEGRVPFGTRDEIPAGHHGVPVPTPARSDLPDAVRRLVHQLLEPAPEARPASATDAVDALTNVRTMREDIGRLLTSDESTVLEFKATLRVPVGPPLPGDKRPAREIEQRLEHEVLKTLAAFLNTDGGTLIIGVADDKSIVGIEEDFPRTKGSADGWRRTLDDVVSHRLGHEVMSFIDLRLEPWDGKTIALIRCSRRDEPTWIDDELYIRRTASTEKLSSRHALAWWRQHWASDPSESAAFRR